MSRRAKLRRELDRELVDGLRARRRRALIERLRGNVEARRDWDRAIAGMRALEDRSVSRFEIDQVERWLFEDLADDGVLTEATPRPARRWTYLAGGLATLAAAASVLLSVGDPEQPGVTDDDLTARGDRSFVRPLAIEPVCGASPRPASARGCSLAEPLGFSVRLGAEDLSAEAAEALAAAPLHLTLFGLSDDGEVRYYLPTPVDPSLPTLTLDSRWQPLPLAIRLGVNHAPGRSRVFALVSDAAPTVADVDRLAAALHPQPRADVDTPPWHLRLDRALFSTLCPDLDRCGSAEAEFELFD